MLALKLAWRNLFRNVRRTVLTCVLISSALIVMILVDGLMIGMIDIMVGGITHTLEGEAQVNRKGFRDNFEVEYVIEDPDEITTELANADKVAGYAPRVIVGSMIASPYNTTGGLVYGVDHSQELQVSRIAEAVYKGTYLTGKDREILLGKEMAKLLEVKLGDRIIITAATVDTNEITQELFRVSGMVEFGPDEMDETLAFINLSQAQRFLGMENRLHQVAIRFHDPENAKRRDLSILAELTDEDNEALSWLDLQPAIGSMIEMSNYATSIVGLILFLLTSLGVINSMFMSIYERIYEFGVAKAIGTTPVQIVQLVLIEALLLAFIACAFGLLIGWLASTYFQEHGVPMGEFEMSGIAITGSIQTQVEAYQFYTYPAYVTLLTVLAAVYPAIFAARIVPTQALHRAL